MSDDLHSVLPDRPPAHLKAVTGYKYEAGGDVELLIDPREIASVEPCSTLSTHMEITLRGGRTFIVERTSGNMETLGWGWW